MPAGRRIQTSLNSGEWALRARGRADLDAYFKGAALLDNVLPLVEGPAMRRPAFEFAAEVKDSAKRSALYGFTRSTETTLMIEAGEDYLRFFDGDTLAPVMDGPAVYEKETTYPTSVAINLYTAQSADVMWFCPEAANFQPRVLIRYEDNDWDFQIYNVRNGPYAPDSFDVANVTPTAVDVGSPVTLGATANIFDDTDTGALFRLYEPNSGVPYKKWAAEEGKDDDPAGITSGQVREYNGRVYQAVGSGVPSNQPPVHDRGTVADGGGSISWSYLHDLSGSVKINAVNSPTSASGTVQERLPSTDATNGWAKGAFSNGYGWPRIVGVYEERLFFASTKVAPDTLYLSRTNGYSAVDADFKPNDAGGTIVNDDHAITRTLADNEVNAPGWAVIDDSLILGTARGLIRITGPSATEAITPQGASAKRIPGSKKASRKFRGFLADNGLAYASIGGAKLYLYEEDGGHRQIAPFASHMGNVEMVKGVWCGEPYNRMFILREDGRLWCVTLSSEHRVEAAARITIGGAFDGGPALVEAMEVLKDDKGYERLWVIVRRSINGGSKRTIERLRLDWRMEANLMDEAFYGDGGVMVDRWNKDGAQKITVTAAADAKPGDEVSLTATGHAPFTGKLGARLAVRKVTPAEGDGRPTVKVTHILIDAVASSTTASGVFEIGPDEDAELLNSANSDWAFLDNEITGLSHLEGEEVSIQIDGMDYGRLTVAAGKVTTDDYFARGAAGLPTPWRARSLPLALNFQDGASKGQPMAIEKAVITMQETGPEQANVRAVEDFYLREAFVLGGRDVDDDMGGPPPPENFSQEVDLSQFAGEEVQLEIFGDGALPATIESIAVGYVGK